MSCLTLYPAGELEFLTNGFGILGDLIDSVVEEELNTKFELTMEYPVDGVHFADIAVGRIITAKPDPVRGAQPFRIYSVSKPLNLRVTVKARHIAYDLKKVTCSPFSALTAPEAVQRLTAGASVDTPIVLSCTLDKAGELAQAKPIDLWTAMGTKKGGILQIYGGEWEFDGFSARLVAQRGQDRDVTIRYGKNLTDFKQEESIAETVNGVHPYWYSKNAVVELPEKVVYAPGEWELKKIKPLDLSDEFDVQPTADQLRERTVKWIADNDLGKPEVSWTIGFVPLSQTEEYRDIEVLERVLIGDTVHVYFPKYGAQVDARAVNVQYRPHLDRYKSITLGSARRSIAKTIAGIKKMQEA